MSESKNDWILPVIIIIGFIAVFSNLHNWFGENDTIAAFIIITILVVGGILLVRR
jgi:hypothetical protein